MDSPRPPLAEITQPSPAPPERHSMKKLLFTLLGLIVLGAVLAGGYAVFTDTFSANEPEAPPTGLLVMAVGVQNEDNSAARIAPAVYYIDGDEFAIVPFDALVGAPEASLAYQHVVSSNHQFVAFLGATDLAGTLSLSDIPLQVYRADISQTSTFDDAVRVLQEASPVTGGAGIFRQSPSISNQGAILYMAHEPEAPEALLASAANEWDIHLVAADGTDTIVAQGIQPKWAGDGRFVFLKNDGLYLYTFADGSERKLWGARGVATAVMSLDVSNDYQYLAWVAPEAGSVTILRALNWEGGTLTLQGIIPMAASAAVFSPDSRFVAVQSLLVSQPENAEAAEAGEAELGVAIEFYDVGTLTRAERAVFINSVDVSQTTLTDWRP